MHHLRQIDSLELFLGSTIRRPSSPDCVPLGNNNLRMSGGHVIPEKAADALFFRGFFTEQESSQLGTVRIDVYHVYVICQHSTPPIIHTSTAESYSTTSVPSQYNSSACHNRIITMRSRGSVWTTAALFMAVSERTQGFLSSSSSTSNSNTHKLCATVGPPPEIAEYIQRKLGGATGTLDDRAAEEIRKKRRKYIQLQKEFDLGEEREARVSPEIAEYLQSRLGTASSPSRTEQISKREEIVSLPARIDTLATFSTAAASSTSSSKKLDVRAEPAPIPSAKAPAVAVPAVAAATAATKIPTGLGDLVPFPPREPSSPEEKRRMELDEKLRAKNEAQRRREAAARFKAESRALAWEDSKRRAEEKARMKREESRTRKEEEPIMTTVKTTVEEPKPQVVASRIQTTRKSKNEVPRQENQESPVSKFNVLSRFQAWKEAKETAEEVEKRKKATVEKLILAHSEALRSTQAGNQAKNESAQATLQELRLDGQAKARYEAWKHSKLEDEKLEAEAQAPSVPQRQRNVVAWQSPPKPAIATTSTTTSTTTAYDKPATSPPFEPRSSPARGLNEEQSPTRGPITVKSVRMRPPVANPSAHQQSARGSKTAAPPMERPFFLQKPEDFYFMVSTAGQMQDRIQIVAN
jgi:hypothetical protein